MLKIKAIVVRQLLGIATFVMCAFLVLIGLSLAAFGITRRRKVSIK